MALEKFHDRKEAMDNTGADTGFPGTEASSRVDESGPTGSSSFMQNNKGNGPAVDKAMFSRPADNLPTRKKTSKGKVEPLNKESTLANRGKFVPG